MLKASPPFLALHAAQNQNSALCRVTLGNRIPGVEAASRGRVWPLVCSAPSTLPAGSESTRQPCPQRSLSASAANSFLCTSGGSVNEESGGEGLCLPAVVTVCSFGLMGIEELKGGTCLLESRIVNANKECLYVGTSQRTESASVNISKAKTPTGVQLSEWWQAACPAGQG